MVSKYTDCEKREIYKAFKLYEFKEYLCKKIDKEFVCYTSTFFTLKEFKDLKVKFKMPTFIKDSMGNLHSDNYNELLTDEKIYNFYKKIEKKYFDHSFQYRNFDESPTLETSMNYMIEQWNYDYKSAFEHCYNFTEYGVLNSINPPNPYTTHPEEYYNKKDYKKGNEIPTINLVVTSETYRMERHHLSSE